MKETELTKVKVFLKKNLFLNNRVTGSCKKSTEKSYVPFIYLSPVVMSYMTIACYNQDLTLGHNHDTNYLFHMQSRVCVCACGCGWVCL